MKLHIVSIHDRALNAYQAPGYVPALGAAIRSFQDMINDTNNPMNKHPEDYDLYHLGTWDDNTGRYDNLPEVKQIAIGKQMRRE